jgi:hypothetical protein
VAQCVWWISSIIGLESELVRHIDRLYGQVTIEEPLRKDEAPVSADHNEYPTMANTPQECTERQDSVLEECEEYLRYSQRLRDIATLRTTGNTKTGRINPLASIKATLKITKQTEKTRRERRIIQQKLVRNLPKTEGIEDSEIQRSKVKQ